MSDIVHIHNRLDLLDEKLDQILIQTTKTNGRVNSLEEHKMKVEKSVSKLIWGIIGTLLTIAGFYIQNYISKH